MSSSDDLNPNQLNWAKRIVAAVKARNLPQDQGERATDIALATAMVESSFQMYANGNNPESLNLPHDAVGWDHGSVGLFQQQVGGAPNSTANWGTTQQLMDVNYSTDRFVDALLRTNWLNMTNGEAAQAVQGSAYPDRYNARDAWAVELRKELWGNTTTSPVPAPAPVSISKPTGPTYTVQQGDTLSSIASKYGTNWENIYNTNSHTIGANPNMIQPGMVLTIPGVVSPPPASAQRRYTVQSGDSLSSIGAKYGVNWQTIYAANRNTIGANPNMIRPGESLIIP